VAGERKRISIKIAQTVKLPPVSHRHLFSEKDKIFEAADVVIQTRNSVVYANAENFREAQNSQENNNAVLPSYSRKIRQYHEPSR